MPQISTSKEKTSVEFYITEECNGCGLCRNVAPEFFDCVDYAYSYFLTRQPASESEVLLLRDVAAICTVDALRETVKTIR
jgi:ferredoxin